MLSHYLPYTPHAARLFCALSALSLAVVSPAQTSGADTSPPSVLGFELDAASVTPTAARMAVTFSEPVTGVDATDFLVNAAAGASATVTGVTPGATAASYFVTFNYAGTAGSIQFALKTAGTGIVDAAGNAFLGAGTVASPVYPVNNTPPADTMPPTVSSFTAPAGALASPLTLTLVFNEPVTGVSAEDFTTSPGATVGTVSGSGSTWTIPVTFTGSAPVSVQLVGGATANIRDLASNWFAGGSNAAVSFTPGSTGGGATAAPVISSPLSASVVAGAPFTYTITASNAPTTLSATGLPAGLTFASPTISGTVTTPGTYNIALAATNGLGTDTKTLSLTVTSTAPAGVQVTNVVGPAPGAYVTGQALTFQVTFSGPVTVAPADGSVLNKPYLTWTSGTQTSPGVRPVGYASGSGANTLTFTYTVQADDQAANGLAVGARIELPAGAAILDAAGNSLSAAALNLPWATNPLTGITVNSAPPPSGGNQPGGSKGSGPVITIKREDGLEPGKPFTLPATTSSGEPITWVLVSGNAVLTNNVLTPKNRGAVVVRALIGSAQTSTSAKTLDYAITPTEPSPGAGPSAKKAAKKERLSNLSSRLQMSGSDRSAFAGFVVNGSAPKQVLIRGVGPSLSAFGVDDAVPAIELQLYNQSGGVLAENRGWNGAPELAAAATRAGAFELKSGSKDSALVATLPPGLYTTKLTSQTEGSALVEVYDLSEAEAVTEQLVNLSTRGNIAAGGGNLIAGFVVKGDAPTRMLIRAVGPTLAGFGVAGALPDAALEVFAAGGASIARNDDWQRPDNGGAAGRAATAADVASAAAAVGAFELPSGSKDAAIIVTLMPGAYTAVMTGARGAAGAGLIEVFELPLQ